MTTVARPARTHRPGRIWRTLAPLWIALTVGAAYAIGSGCAWLLFHASAVGAVFFPPAGVTLGALILVRRRHWVWVLGAAGTVEFGINLWQGLDPMAAAGFVLTNVAEPLVGATLLRHFRPDRIDLTRYRDAVAFLGCAVGAGPLFGAVIGASTSVLSMEAGWWAAFGRFWAGDGLAVLTLGAALVGLDSARGRFRLGRALRGVAALGTTAALTVVGFWPREVPLAYLPVPVLLAVGFRGRVATVGASGFVMAFFANLLSAAGRGPWSGLASQPRLEAATLQVYLAVVVLGAWALSVAVAQRDRAQAESRREVAARRRLQALQDVTAGLATAATSDQVVRVLVEQGVSLVADHGAVALTDGGGRRLRTWTTDAVPEKVADRFAELPLDAGGRVPIVDAVRTARPIRLPSLAALTARYPELAATQAEPGIRSLLVLPIRAGDRCLGALAFAFHHDDAISPEVASIAQTLAELAGQAVERAQLYEAEHAAAHELQRSLLPDISDDLPGVTAGVCYQPAERGRDVGGDWYDVFELPGNRVAIAVGDVVGHGLSAAITMGRLQQTLRSVARTGAAPVEVLEALDTACGTIAGADYTTVGYAEYSPTDRLLTYACAGHPPPLLVADGVATYLTGARSLPLRLVPWTRRQAQLRVPDGALLVWYSDGLIERRDQVIDTGLGRLSTIAAGLPGDEPQQWCDRLLTDMTAGQAITDDIVVVCVRLGGLPTDGEQATVLRATLSSPADLAATRQALRRWSAGHEMSADQTDALLATCNEALINALEHAYHGRPAGPVALQVVLLDRQQVRVEVTDRGAWRGHSYGDGDRGRGLDLINRLSRRAVLDLSEAGTRVTITLPGR
ncbi:SpoIIE family protein phosphatase [Solwaraspora sp. WMMD406]|uniref:SpoIIE family protein phosphatase n=1 Tax=Solwaraspora sp. WMMD406 TaxID=3016095 RepID=UPI002417BDBA|nr:SpoIIE family protein phosphatase [Solwaraspora sp. WMMD406]MDG4762691.1 SpoIIE family protein phosphatase [Solwaraspora sp. WMMD406]